MANPPIDSYFDYIPPPYEVNPLVFLILSIVEVVFYLLLIVYPIVQISNQIQISPEKTPSSHLETIKDGNQIKEKTKKVADLVLQSRNLDMGYRRDGVEIFVGEIQGERILFLMEHFPILQLVAMNYSHLWPKKKTLLESINTTIAIPDLDQMEKFLEVIEEIILL